MPRYIRHVIWTEKYSILVLLKYSVVGLKISKLKKPIESELCQFCQILTFIIIFFRLMYIHKIKANYLLLESSIAFCLHCVLLFATLFRMLKNQIFYLRIILSFFSLEKQNHILLPCTVDHSFWLYLFYTHLITHCMTLTKATNFSLADSTVLKKKNTQNLTVI